MSQIDTSPEAVERAARGAWLAHQQTAADMLRAVACERDEALAREAVLREALGDIVADMSRRGTVAANTAGAALVRLGVHSAEASAARDAALVARGRREGIEEAARRLEAHSFGLPVIETAVELLRAIAAATAAKTENGCGNG